MSLIETSTVGESRQPVNNPAAPKTRSRVWVDILFWLGIAALVIFSLTPILWQLLTSFKVNEDIVAVPNVYIPTRFTFDHYLELFARRPVWHYLFNSLLVSLSATLACLVIGTPAAYALARSRPRGSVVFQSGLLFITLFPGILLLQGLLEIVQRLQLGNNYLSLILPYTAINLPLTILVLRNFFVQLPKDLEDAAKVDGYNTLQMMVYILLPLTLPALAAAGILTFIAAWNEFIFALTFITEETMKTIPVASAQIGGSSVFEIPYGEIAAATVLGTLPLVILVLLFQRQIVQSLTAGAVKG